MLILSVCVDSVETVRKEKSLGIMSQKFLMLFLVSQVGHIHLLFLSCIPS